MATAPVTIARSLGSKVGEVMGSGRFILAYAYYSVGEDGGLSD